MPWGVKAGAFKGKGIYNFTGDVSMCCANVVFLGGGGGRRPVTIIYWFAAVKIKNNINITSGLGPLNSDNNTSPEHIYRPQTKLREGNVFTPVCQSFCSKGEGACVTCMPPGHTRPQPPGHASHPTPQPCLPPPADTTRYGQWAGGTHPTGMQSCLFFVSTCKTINIDKSFSSH